MSTMIASQAAATPKIAVTPEELLAMPDGGHYELIDGELKERRVSALSNAFASTTNYPAKTFSVASGARLSTSSPKQPEVETTGPTKSDAVSPPSAS
jgi:hypothetical protein